MARTGANTSSRPAVLSPTMVSAATSAPPRLLQLDDEVPVARGADVVGVVRVLGAAVGAPEVDVAGLRLVGLPAAVAVHDLELAAVDDDDHVVAMVRVERDRLAGVEDEVPHLDAVVLVELGGADAGGACARHGERHLATSGACEAMCFLSKGARGEAGASSGGAYAPPCRVLALGARDVRQNPGTEDVAMADNAKNT